MEQRSKVSPDDYAFVIGQLSSEYIYVHECGDA
jgi:hypothetical protein